MKKGKSTTKFTAYATMTNAYEKKEEQLLRSRYKNAKGIVDRLCEISTHAGTYEFLGELFFKFAVHTLQHDPPARVRIQQLRIIQFEVMELYELARAAKALQQVKLRRKNKTKP